jgi:hypothetical protein
MATLVVPFPRIIIDLTMIYGGLLILRSSCNFLCGLRCTCNLLCQNGSALTRNCYEERVRSTELLQFFPFSTYHDFLRFSRRERL